jgi:CMD domain protein
VSAIDVIDHLTGIEPGSSLDRIRARRPQARENAEASYDALFEPRAAGGLALKDRFAVAAFVAGLHRHAAARDFYGARLALHTEDAFVRAIADEAAAGVFEGPYGSYPPGPLSAENRPGPDFRVAAARRALLGEPLSAALDHAHLLVFHPRDASPKALQTLLDAGLSTTDVVTVSQIVAFLSFQIRVVAGLTQLGRLNPVVPDTAGEVS